MTKETADWFGPQDLGDIVKIVFNGPTSDSQLEFDDAGAVIQKEKEIAVRRKLGIFY